MANNRGKQFESKLKSDFLASIPNCSIDRLYDSVSGYKAVSNISDFIAFKQPCIYYLEAKSHQGNTFPLANLTQYDKLVTKVGIPGVRAGVILWMVEKDYVLYLPISFITYLKQNGYKSFNIKMIDNAAINSRFLVLPSVKKRVFLDTDYSPLLNLPDGW